MNLPRIFASAVVRRVAYLLVAFILAGLGIGTARAQTYPCEGSGSTCTRPQAYASCMQEMAAVIAWAPTIGWSVDNERCNHAGNGTLGHYQPQGIYRNASGTHVDNFNGRTHLYISGCPAGTTWDENTHTCGTCQDKPSLGNTAWSGVNASDQMCKDECVFEGGAGDDFGICIDQIVDAQRYRRCTSWAPTGGTCSVSGPGGGFPSAPSEAPTDTDNDGTSDGNDGAPNNPGQGGGGEDGPPGEDDAGTCGGVGQPECGTPGTGSGNGNTSGGGIDCGSPPSSTGDAIAAQIAYQAWATRCAVEGLRKDMGGGDGGTGEEPGGGDAGAVEGSDSIYEGRGDTASDILDSFAAQAQQTALVGAVEAFFAAPPSGSCPVWVLPANAFFDAITFDFHCSGQFATILGYAGWVLMACVAVLAIRIAIT